MTKPRENLSRGIGSDDKPKRELPPDQEPVVTGTLFLMVILLITIFGFWALMYLTLLER